MQYSIALVAALASGVFAVPGSPPVSEYTDGQPQVPTGGSYPIAPPPTYTHPAAESTIYTTEEVTITSCAATVTNCPAHSTQVYTTTYPVSSPPAVTSYPAQSPPAASSYPAYTPPAASSYPAVPPPAYSSQVVPPPISPQVSVQTISTCVPTVIYSTHTIPAASSAPYPVGTPPAAGAPAPSGSGHASGTGSTPYPTSSPISPATGAGSALTNSMMGVAAAALAAIVLA